MSRPLRIEFPGAWYHVMNRGRHGEAIFVTDEDRGIFVDLLKESVQQWNVKITAYCLLTTHYHLLVQMTRIFKPHELHFARSKIIVDRLGMFGVYGCITS